MSKGFKGIARIRSILECLALSRETKFKFKWAAFGIGCGFRCEINGVYVFITRRTYKFFNTAQDITYRWGGSGDKPVYYIVGKYSELALPGECLDGTYAIQDPNHSTTPNMVGLTIE